MALKLEDESGRLQVSNTRIFLICFFCLALVCYLVGRLLWIQVLYPEKLIAEGNARVIRNYQYEPPRGLITDRNGKIFALSVPVKTVDAVPRWLHEEGVYADKTKM